MRCLNITNQLLNDPEKSGIYHFSGAPDVSWCSFANTILEKAGRSSIAVPILTTDYKTKAKRPQNSRLDCSLTEKTFKINRPLWHDEVKNFN